MLFNFGTEKCIFSKLWKRWWWGGGGKLRRRCCVSSFSNCYFSDKNYQNGVRDTFNFHFLLCFPKNGVKQSKNPSLDDSRNSNRRNIQKVLCISCSNSKKGVLLHNASFSSPPTKTCLFSYSWQTFAHPQGRRGEELVMAG